MCIRLISFILILFSLLTSSCDCSDITGAGSDKSLYYIDYENGTVPVSELPIGSRVVDSSWEWEYRLGKNYSREVWHPEQSGPAKIKPVTWIVVAHDFYEGSEHHVTLLSEELIAYYAFDDSTDRGSTYGSNHWGNSGTSDAEHGLRLWLNSEGIHSGEGFYKAFAFNFKQNIVTVDLPNCEWENNTFYTTKDRIFIPSREELGGGNSSCGQAYPFFKGFMRSQADNRIAVLGDLEIWYWTRTPGSSSYMLTGINPGGGFMDYVANHGDHAVRAVINLKAEVPVSEVNPATSLANRVSQ